MFATFRKSQVGLGAVLFALVLSPATAQEPTEPDSTDTTPPHVFVLPHEWQNDADQFVLQAQVRDDSGIDSVVAHVRTNPNGEFIATPMRPGTEDDRWELDVPAGDSPAPLIEYYVEAFDSTGLGPGRSGTPAMPFVAEVKEEVSTEPGSDRSAGGRPALAFGLFCVGLLVVGLLLKRSKPETAPAVIRSVRKSTGVSVTRPRAKRDPLQIAEDIFWLCLMDPVTGLPEEAAEETLEELSDEPQIHPVDGLRMYDVRELRERLWWARLADMELLFTQWKSVNDDDKHDGRIPVELLAQTDRRIAEFKIRERSLRDKR